MESNANGHLSTRGKAYSKLSLVFGEKFITNFMIQISVQVHLSAQLQLGSNLNKTERTVFVVNFRRNLE